MTRPTDRHGSRGRPDAPPPTREVILRAAEECFAANGFAGARVADVARRAGVPRPLVVYHFGTKEALWEAVVERVFGSLREDFERAASGLNGLDSASKLKLLFRRYLLYCARHPILQRIIYWAGAEGGPRLEQITSAYLEPLIRTFREQLYPMVAPDRLPIFPEGALLMLVATSSLTGVGPLVERVHGVDLADDRTLMSLADGVVETILAASGRPLQPSAT